MPVAKHKAWSRDGALGGQCLIVEFIMFYLHFGPDFLKLPDVAPHKIAHLAHTILIYAARKTGPYRFIVTNPGASDPEMDRGVNTKMAFRNSKLLAPSVLALSIGIGAPAMAQEAPGSEPPVGAEEETYALEEIVVTARRREEALLAVPESVVAFGSVELQQRGIDDLASIGSVVPNLNLSQRSDGYPNVTIRGVGGFGNTQGVGFYLDDVQLFSDASSRFGDLQRMEVLKGPQGTLYGGSNIGGAIKFVSARPEAGDVFGYVRGRVGSQNLRDIEASLNIPLGESDWAVRAFGFYSEHDGFLTNANPARLNGETGNNDPDIGATAEMGGRIMIAGPITDRLSLFASARFNRYDGVGNTWIREISDSDFGYSTDVNNSRNSDHERETRALMAELALNLDHGTVTAITSYTDTWSDTYTDLDMREEFIFDIFRAHDTEVFTQELRYTSDLAGPFNWIGGLFYSRNAERIRSDQVWFDARVDGDGNFSGPLGCSAGMPTCSGVWVGEIPTPEQEMDILTFPNEQRDRVRTHMAAFANGSYEWDVWALDAGVRVDRWSNRTTNVLSGITSERDDVEILPRVSLTRWFSDVTMAYVTYARGYEPGGFNLANFVGESSLFGYDEEQSTSYELGFKTRLLDNRAALTLAGFHIDYRDRQIEYQDRSGDQIIEGVINLGDSRSWGVEAEFEVQATENLNISASAGWTDATWQDGAIVDRITDVIDMSGTQVPYTKDITWVLAARYDRWLDVFGGAELMIGGQLSYSSDFLGLHAWDPVRNPDYTLLNLQVGLTGSNWEFLIQAENVTDEAYFTDLTRFPNLHALDGGDTVVAGTLGQPRMITATFTRRF